VLKSLPVAISMSRRPRTGALKGGRQEAVFQFSETPAPRLPPNEYNDCHNSVSQATTDASLDPSYTELPVISGRPKGFRNVGNTCYANAVLQCLLSTALTEALLDPKSFSPQRDVICPQKPDRDTKNKCKWLTRELKTISSTYHKKEFTLFANTVDPSAITKHPDRLSPCLRPYQQEDAHEFLRALLSTLVMNGQNRRLSSLFDGLLESSVTCHTCKRPSLTRDRYMDISLDILPSSITTLTDALAQFTAPEVLTKENAVACQHCKSKGVATKEMRLATAPSILVCHLKRFTVRNGKLSRIHKHVHFPQRLYLNSYMSSVNQSRPPAYELVALLVHHGRTCEYGHYVAYILRPDGLWYRCDDDSVTRVSVETVLAQPAYLLWYQVADLRKESSCASYYNKSMFFCGMDDPSVWRDMCCGWQPKSRRTYANLRKSRSSDNLRE